MCRVCAVEKISLHEIQQMFVQYGYSYTKFTKLLFSHPRQQIANGWVDIESHLRLISRSLVPSHSRLVGSNCFLLSIVDLLLFVVEPNWIAFGMRSSPSTANDALIRSRTIDSEVLLSVFALAQIYLAGRFSWVLSSLSFNRKRCGFMGVSEERSLVWIAHELSSRRGIIVGILLFGNRTIIEALQKDIFADLPIQ